MKGGFLGKKGSVSLLLSWEHTGFVGCTQLVTWASSLGLIMVRLNQR